MLEGPPPEGSPAESPAGEGGTALPLAAAAAGPGQVEGAPSGLPQEEGETGSNSPIPLCGRTVQARKPPPRKEEVLPAERRAASVGAGWLGSCGHKAAKSPSGMAGRKPASDQAFLGRKWLSRETEFTLNHGLSELGDLRSHLEAPAWCRRPLA